MCLIGPGVNNPEVKFPDSNAILATMKVIVWFIGPIYELFVQPLHTLRYSGFTWTKVYIEQLSLSVRKKTPKMHFKAVFLCYLNTNR